MNIDSSNSFDDPGAAGTANPVSNPRQHGRFILLKAMLDDRDWASAYNDRSELRQALAELINAAINEEPELDERTLQVLALEAEDYEDFRAFREEWIREEGAVTGTAPQQWLRARLRAWEQAERENQSRAGRFERSFWSGNERFRVI